DRLPVNSESLGLSIFKAGLTIGKYLLYHKMVQFCSFFLTTHHSLRTTHHLLMTNDANLSNYVNIL
ncbi:hypothetical protein, partial [Chroococcidiopsis sp.]|uniref:hypothetical protein n=1 Tax=Chroococcidiopsis sp. TaxID=3088168 RepID=UPI003F3A98B0